MQIERPLAQIIEAIGFIPALSRKYTFAKADPALHVYTLSGSEPLTAGAYVDIHCSAAGESGTGVTLEVRRKKGAFAKSREVSLANQHIDTVFNLLSDSLALEPSKRSRLLSEQTNTKTAGEYRTSQAKAGTQEQDEEEKQPSTSLKRMTLSIALLAALAVLLFVLFWGLNR